MRFVFSKPSASLACVLVAASAGVCLAQSASGLFRARTDLVAVDVSVKDHSGRYVESLTPDDFLVLEDNVPQKVLFFSPGGRIPLAVALLVDFSQSMAGEPLVRAKSAAQKFLDGLQPEDLVEVVAFNDVPARVYPMGSDHAAARSAIDGLEARGTTRLYDAILLAQRDLDKAAHASPDERQRAMVILSDGEDTRSAETFEDVLDDARRNTTEISAISVRADAHRRWLPPLHELTQLTADTGGQTIAVRALDDLASAYESIGTDLRGQYRLGYLPSSPNKDGRWRQLSVRMKSANCLARTRSGYYY
jgi:VWFA-related protein